MLCDCMYAMGCAWVNPGRTMRGAVCALAPTGVLATTICAERQHAQPQRGNRAEFTLLPSRLPCPASLGRPRQAEYDANRTHEERCGAAKIRTSLTCANMPYTYVSSMLPTTSPTQRVFCACEVMTRADWCDQAVFERHVAEITGHTESTVWGGGTGGMLDAG